MAGYQCESCGKRRTGTPQTSVTGRLLCPTCQASINGLAAGMIAGGSMDKGATPEVVAQAIATEGWFQRLLRRKRSGSDEAPND